MYRKLIVTTLGLLFVGSLVAQDRNTVPPPQVNNPMAGALYVPASVAPPNYRIGDGDVVGVTAYGTPELNRTIAVGADGRLLLPYLTSPVPARGKTAQEVAKAIAAMLIEQQIVVDPQVDVAVLDVRSHAIAISGAVLHPTVIYADRPIPLLDAILRAGGPDVDRAGATVSLAVPPSDNGQDGAPASSPAPLLTLQIPYRFLTDGAHPESNVMLHGGEQVEIVPGGVIFVSGSVKKPGAFPIKLGEPLTVSKAMALAEGWDSSADLSKAVIIRNSPGAPLQAIPINISAIMARKVADPALQTNDLVYVPVNGMKRATLGTASAAASSFFYAIALISTAGLR